MSPHPDWDEAGLLVMFRLEELDKVRSKHAREIAILKDKLEGKWKQDIDEAHNKIRGLNEKLQAQHATHGLTKIKLWAAVSAASFLSAVVVSLLHLLVK